MKKILALLIGISLITYAVIKLLLGPSGFIRQFSIDNENHQLHIEVDSLKAEIIRKEKEIQDLETNLFIIEKKARTELGMTREGELVFRFKTGDSSELKP